MAKIKRFGVYCVSITICLFVISMTPYSLYIKNLEKGRKVQAEKTLHELSGLFSVALQSGVLLEYVTGRNCSECPCRGQDLIYLPNVNVCVQQWEEAVMRLFQLLKIQGSAVPVSFLRDPWNSPYAINENAASIRSAGPDGVLYTLDDLAVEIVGARLQQ